MIYLVVMAAIIFGVDFAFFRNRFWERLAQAIWSCVLIGVLSFK